MTLEYVERGGEQTYRPPYSAEGVRFYSFLLEADTDRLLAFLQKCVTTPSGGAVELTPAAPYVLLSFTELKCLRSINPPDSDKGWTSEKEVSIFFLALDEKRQRLGWICPYMFVDSGYAMASGREVYGFPKQIGWITLPEDGKMISPMVLETMGIERFSPQSEQQRLRLIEVDGPGAVGGKLEATWSGLSEMCWDVAKLAIGDAARVFVPASPGSTGSGKGLLGKIIGFLRRVVVQTKRDATLALHIAEEVASVKAPIILLKQFRSSDQPRKASYQAIIQAFGRVTAFRGGGVLPGEYGIKISDPQSVDIRQDLGLAEGTLTPKLAFWADLDFCLDEGTELWNASSAVATAGPRKP
jgi:hypothetical protein